MCFTLVFQPALVCLIPGFQNLQTLGHLFMLCPQAVALLRNDFEPGVHAFC
jgi:hypothetical protein